MSDKKLHAATIYKNLAIFTIFALFSIPAPAGDEVSAAKSSQSDKEDLASLRQAYETNLARIEAEYTNKTTQVSTRYIKDLKDLQQKIQRDGNLDGWLVVHEEIKRFEAEQTPTTAPLGMTDELSRLELNYQKTFFEYSQQRNKKILSLTKTHTDKLTALQKNLTVAGRILDAMGVKEETSSVWSNTLVVSAKMAMSALPQETALPPPQEEKPPETRKIPPGDSLEKRDEPAPTPYGVRPPQVPPAKIYDNEEPPDIPGISFKNMSLSVTERIPLKQLKLSASAMLGALPYMDTTSDRSSYSKSGNTDHYLRVGLKTSNTAYTQADAKLVVQYFAKESTRGTIVPILVRTEVISLPILVASKWVNVDCRPLPLYSSTYRNQSTYGSNYRHASGVKFYGVIISVFEPKGTLIYQGTSVRSLDKLGVTEVPQEELFPGQSSRRPSMESKD